MKTTKLVTTAAVFALGATLIAPSVLAAPTEQAGEGTISFKQGDRTTKPTDPEKPGTKDPVEPGDGGENTENGPLTVDFVSHLRFDENDITTSEGRYFAKPTPLKVNGVDEVRGNYVQVTDKRSADTRTDGWQLSAKLTKQFTTADAKSVLTGAVLNYSEAYVATNKDTLDLTNPANFTLKFDESVDVLKAEGDKGWGTYTVEFGRPATADNGIAEDAATAGKAVELVVPANTPLAAQEYKAEIVWTIAEL